MRGTLLGVKDTKIKKKKSQIIINATRKSKGMISGVMSVLFEIQGLGKPL